jgi:hypothetical protein
LGKSQLPANNTESTADEELVRKYMEQAIAIQPSTAVPVAVYQALAKSAPPHTEARKVAYLDGQIAYLLHQILPEKCRAARRANEIVQLLSRIKPT